MLPFVDQWAQGLFFENWSPNRALGLGKFEPHDFRTKNTRTNRIKLKNQFWQRNRTGLHLDLHYLGVVAIANDNLNVYT